VQTKEGVFFDFSSNIGFSEENETPPVHYWICLHDVPEV
jgi:hypothetical protein